MIVFQVSLTFDPVNEILKIRYQIFFMKKVIILNKIQMTMNTFAPSFFNHFSLSLNRKRRVVIRAMRKKLNIFTLQLPIRLGNLIWCKCKYCKNEAREIDCPYCREVDAMLIASAKIPERKGKILPFSFYVQLLNY